MMSETHGWTERLSDYLNGDLHAAERADLEAHLVECDECRRVLEDLRDLIARARDLPESVPARDLWPGIAAAINAPLAGGGQVIALPAAEAPETVRRARGIVVTGPQLAAASVVLAVASALTTWWVAGGHTSRASEEGGATPAPGWVAATDMPAASAGLGQEVRELERALAVSSAALDPRTRRIIEKNLAVIERAIEESRRALAVDPGNAFLVDHLDRAYRRKLTYLRDATELTGWSG